MRYRTTSTALAAVLLAATACGGDDSGGSSSERTGSSEPTGSSECAGEPAVEVTDPGSAPRKPMKLSPTKGDSVALDMLMNMDIEATVDGQSAPLQSIPPITLGMQLTVDDVRADEVEMSFVYDKLTVDDPTLQDKLGTIVDSSGTIVTTRNGAYVDGDFEAAPGLDPSMAATTEQLEQQLADITVPLPEKPVGVGAEWTVETSLELSGIEFCNTYTYRLAEFDGDSYKLETEMEQDPVEGGVVETAGATIEVVEGSGHATGTQFGTLSFPIAQTASVQAESQMEQAVESGGQEATQEISTSIDMEVSQRKS